MSIKPGITILLYHEIGPHPRPFANLDCFCVQDMLREQMRLLKAQSVPVLTAHEACEHLHGARRMDTDAVVLTFDDGDTGFLEYALPVLEEFGLPTTVFAVAGLLGEQAGWVRDQRNAFALMTAQQLQSLDARQFEIGSHSMTHRKLTELSPAQAADELRESKELLEDILGRPVTSFAYPHGHYDASTIALVDAIGYHYAYSTDGQRTFGNLADRLCLPRTYITYHDDLNGFALKLGLMRSESACSTSIRAVI